MNAPKKILVVENDASTRALLAQALVDEGHVVTTVSSARAALAELEAVDFDLLVTNYYLGGATGTWLARIAADGNGVHIPRVLLVSAYDDDELGDRGRPFDLLRFLREVDEVLGTGTEPILPSHEPAQRIALTLYCNGSLCSHRATRRLTETLRRYARDQIALTIIDVSEDQDRAEDDRVVATPTLLRTFPGPRLWIAGDLEEDGALRRILEQAGVDAHG